MNTTENNSVAIGLPGTWSYVEVTSGPAHGRLENDTHGGFDYTPGTDFRGTDTFQYAGYDGNWKSVTGTVTINVAAGEDLPSDPVPGPAPTYSEPPAAAPSYGAVVIGPFQGYTTDNGSVTIFNGSYARILASFQPENEVDISPLDLVDSYDTTVSTNCGYENATWGGPYGTYFQFNVAGSILGDLISPDTNFDLSAGNTIGAVSGTDVFEGSGFGVGLLAVGKLPINDRFIAHETVRTTGAANKSGPS